MKKTSKKVSFDTIHAMYVELTEATANIGYVATVVIRKWGKGYVVVTADGLQIEDGEATRGQCMYTCILCTLTCLLISHQSMSYPDPV